MGSEDPHVLTSLAGLEALYDAPSERVRRKQIDRLDAHCRAVLVVTVQEAFIQCARALVRSDLWNPEHHVRRADLPSLGTVLAAHTGGLVDAEAYDAEASVTMPKTLY